MKRRSETRLDEATIRQLEEDHERELWIESLEAPGASRREPVENGEARRVPTPLGEGTHWRRFRPVRPSSVPSSNLPLYDQDDEDCPWHPWMPFGRCPLDGPDKER